MTYCRDRQPTPPPIPSPTDDQDILMDMLFFGSVCLVMGGFLLAVLWVFV